MRFAGLRDHFGATHYLVRREQPEFAAHLVFKESGGFVYRLDTIEKNGPKDWPPSHIEPKPTTYTQRRFLVGGCYSPRRCWVQPYAYISSGKTW